MRTSLTFMIKGKELFWNRFKWTGNKIQKSVIFAPADNTTQYFKPQLTVSNIKLFTPSFALKCRLAFYMRDYSSINEGLKYLVYCIFLQSRTTKLQLTLQFELDITEMTLNP